MTIYCIKQNKTKNTNNKSKGLPIFQPPNIDTIKVI